MSTSPNLINTQDVDQRKVTRSACRTAVVWGFIDGCRIICITRMYDRLNFTLDRLKWDRENPGTLVVKLHFLNRILYEKFKEVFKYQFTLILMGKH